MQRDVVITGMGVVSPLGHTPEAFFASLLEGRSGISNITRFDTSAYSVHFAGEVKDFDASAVLRRQGSGPHLALHPIHHACGPDRGRECRTQGRQGAWT